MKKISLVIALLATTGIITSAQSDYQKAIGIRISSHTDYAFLSASYKIFISDPGAIELDIGFGRRNRYSIFEAKNAQTSGASFAGTYQHHFNFESAKGLQWFIGGGLVMFNSFSKTDYYDGFGLGAYPTAGIDYKFNAIPLNLSVDFRPTFHLTAPSGYGSVHGHDVGIAARYTF